MENNEVQTQEEADAPQGDVPQAEVEKVIAENGNQPIEEYKDLTGEQTPTPEQEAQAKIELKKTLIVENPQPEVEAAPVEAAPVEAAPVEAAPVEAAPVEAAPVTQPSVNLGEQSGSLPLDNQPAAEPAQASQPNLVKNSMGMKLLQFECDACKFKVYVNLEDDKLEELPTKLKCMNCGKKKSIKRRILDMTINRVVNYIEPDEDPVAQPETSTQ